MEFQLYRMCIKKLHKLTSPKNFFYTFRQTLLGHPQEKLSKFYWIPGICSNFCFPPHCIHVCNFVTRQLKIQEPANKAVCAELFVQNKTEYTGQTAFRNNLSQDSSIKIIDTCSVQRA
jgi:hypothetical protein